MLIRYRPRDEQINNQRGNSMEQDDWGMARDYSSMEECENLFVSKLEGRMTARKQDFPLIIAVPFCSISILPSNIQIKAHYLVIKATDAR